MLVRIWVWALRYKFAPHWSVAGEYTNTSGKNNGLKLNNNNFTVGLNYYFSEPYVAPASGCSGCGRCT